MSWSPIALAGEPFLRLDAGYKYGDFGTDLRTDLYSFTATVGTISTQADASLSVPFLIVDEEGSDNASGFGDMVLRGGHILLPEDEDGFSLYGSAALKLPTGDENEGLSSGETDIGGTLSFYQRWSAFKGGLHLGFIKVGDPPGTDYDDVLVYGISAMKTFRRTGIQLGLEGSTASGDEVDDPLALSLGVFHNLSYQHSLTTNISIGLTDGSPDAGITVGWINWF